MGRQLGWDIGGEPHHPIETRQCAGVKFAVMTQTHHIQFALNGQQKLLHPYSRFFRECRAMAWDFLMIRRMKAASCECSDRWK